MKYKVGDKVRIKSKEWYEQNKDENGDITLSDGNHFWECMKELLGKYFTIRRASCGWYDLKENIYKITDEMIDDSLSYNTEKSIISEEMIKDIAEVIKKHNLGVSVSENDGKLIIEPLKVEEEEDLPIDTPVMCSLDAKTWSLGYYYKNGRVWLGCFTSKNGLVHKPYDYIITFDKFNPNNIKESLKYNIVK